MKKKINIQGMSCMHCVMHVKNALLDIKGVTDVDVNLKEHYALVETDGEKDEDIITAIKEAGYIVVEIENIK